MVCNIYCQCMCQSWFVIYQFSKGQLSHVMLFHTIDVAVIRYEQRILRLFKLFSSRIIRTSSDNNAFSQYIGINITKIAVSRSVSTLDQKLGTQTQSIKWDTHWNLQQRPCVIGMKCTTAVSRVCTCVYSERNPSHWGWNDRVGRKEVCRR